VSNPSLHCDLVMQGGITSGIVYPPAVLELKDTYTFRSIGGTSAGAIAAAGIAAAELNREHGGFEFLQQHIQEWLTQGDHLRHLFQAEPETQPLMDVLNATLEMLDEGTAKTTAPPAGTAVPAAQSSSEPNYLFLRFVQRLMPIFPPFVFTIGNKLIHTWTLPGQSASPVYAPFHQGGRRGLLWGMIIGLVLAVVLSLALLGVLSLLGSRPNGWTLRGVLLVFVVFAGVLGPLVGWFGLWTGRALGTVVQLVNTVLTGLPKNFYGLCSGHSAHPDGTNLTDWLDTVLRQMSGEPQTTPLTFAQLKAKQIQLKMVTSNVSHGQPYVLPEGLHNFVFRKEDMDRLFPEAIVQYMIQTPPDPGDPDPAKRPLVPSEHLPDGYYFLPTEDKLPVVFCARLSLSFPFLLSAVPLYTISTRAYANYTNAVKQKQNPARLTTGDLQRNWFSDGGVCSNFPIQFFDAWLPVRPTFGINLTSSSPATSVLQAYDTGQQAAATVASSDDAVYLPKAEERQDPEWSDVQNLFSFGLAIFGTAQNYRDTMQAHLPSYRERIVQVRLDAAEGGLNLTMPKPVIDKVVTKGHDAGKVLLDQFDFQHHVWVRFQVLMAQLEENFRQMQGVLNYPSFEQILKEQCKENENAPPLDGSQQDKPSSQVLMARLEALKNMIKEWNQLPGDGTATHGPLYKDAPISNPVLRVTPEV
jgi:predicted acylesterase/phospholipase RssA